MKNLKTLAAMVLMLLCSVTSYAYDFEVDGIYYNYNIDGNSVSVTSNNNSYSGDVVIPATVTYNDVVYNVTSIGSYAFSDCSSLTSVTIPQSVTEVALAAFRGCSSLTSVTIPASVTSIGVRTFGDCVSLKELVFEDATEPLQFGYPIDSEPLFLDCPIEKLYLGRDLSYATDYTIHAPFRNQTGLTSVTISDKVTTLADNLFYGCSGLTSVTIPQGVTSIGNSAFNNCSGLTSVTIPQSVTSIGSEAFNGCSKLTDIHISSIESWLTIEYGNNYSHPNCASNKAVNLYIDGEVVTAVEIPSTVTTIPNFAFYQCSGLTSVTIPNSVTSIGSYAFRDCSGLTSVTIPQGVTSIGNGAFFACSGLTSVTIPQGVTSIDSYAFCDCSALTSVTIPQGVTSIGSYAFRDCSGLTSVTIPQSVTSIGSEAFNGCSKLTDIHISSIESWLTIGFHSTYSYPNLASGQDVNLYIDGEVVTEVEIPSTVTTIPYNAFYNCSGLTSVTIPQGVTSIGNGAFFACSGLTSVTIPQSVTSIGESAFYGCSKLTDIHISSIESWLTIGFHSTYSYPNLASGQDVNLYIDGEVVTEVEIPSTVTTIPYNAFYNCSGLTSVTIPQGVTSIGNDAFSNVNCEITVLATSPITLASTKVFSSDAWFVVPADNYDDYCAAQYWSDMKDRITRDDIYVQNLPLNAADNKSALQVEIGDENLPLVTNLTISGTINSYDFMIMRNKMPMLRYLDLSQATIVHNDYEHYTGYHTEDNIFPAYGLYNCNLHKLVLPNNIKGEFGAHGVYHNEKLKEIIIPQGVTSIGSYAFYGCRGLTSVTIPQGVTSIRLYAFSTCSSLAKIILPPTLKNIYNSAFTHCDKLEEIRIPSSVRKIDDNAFNYCYNLLDVYVYTVEPFSIAQDAFTKVDNNFKGTLHAPKVSYWDYYYNTQWSQFLNFAEFDEPYENFYLEGDKVLDENTGSIEGEGDNNPDAEMGENSGIIVEDDVKQDLGDVDIEHDGENGGSIIVDGSGEVNADKLTFRINVQGGRWYFFCFPFDVRAEDIRCEGGAEWIFRYYDGNERAKNGKGGWKNVTSDGNGNFLKAATGYIFQCSKNDVLLLSAKNGKIKKEDKYNELVEHITENAQDASWNFVGNPYLSYYEITSNDYSAPITVWNGSNYIAIRPGDDDYQLAPFEAFFVQKPNGKDKVNYNSDNQKTYKQSKKAAADARLARSKQAINPNRLLVNITLSNGKQTDKTRVVFNNEADMKYEAECDAAKFSAADVPQLYTLDAKAVKYAINERPVAQGNVTLGYTAPVEGQYVLEAPRMDTPMLLMDNVTGTVHDFTDGAYEFTTEAGSYDARFTLIINGNATGINGVEGTESDGPIYNIKGQQVKDMKENGVYIKNNRKVISK